MPGREQHKQHVTSNQWYKCTSAIGSTTKNHQGNTKNSKSTQVASHHNIESNSGQDGGQVTRGQGCSITAANLILRNPRPNSGRKLTIGTYNVENIKSNFMYVHKLLEICDVLCLQEHWLHTYEKSVLSDMFPEHKVLIRCHDHEEQVLHAQHGRGHAGVAILWSKEVDTIAIPAEDDGNNRNIAITLQLMPTPITVINSYMPAGNTACEVQSYARELDHVYELTAKFQQRGSVLWIGDLNGSLHIQRHTRDRLLQAYCSETKYTVVSDDITPTFYHNANDSTSRIDHILQPIDQETHVESIYVRTREPVNTSTHDPLIATLNATLDEQPVTQNSRDNKITSEQVRPKMNWKKVNLEEYSRITEERADRLLNRLDPNNLSTEELLMELNELLYASAKECSPQPRSTKRQPPRLVWRPELKPLIAEAKKAHWEWKAAGKPSDKQNQLAIAKARTKRNLRSMQRQLVAEQRRGKLSEIMTASARDTRLFYRLIKQQRGHTSNPECMQFEGRMVMGDELLSTWTQYFSKLATPTDKPEYDREYKATVESCVKELGKIYSNDREYDILPEVTTDMVQNCINELKTGKAADSHGISSEHLKNAGPRVTDLLALLIDAVIKVREIPSGMKNGIITPVYKNKNSPKLPDNYRRITVTSLAGKILEKVIVKPTKEVLLPNISKLQRGFCNNASSINTAFLLSEAVSEAQDKKMLLYAAMLDASKAFDVVWHPGMLLSLANQGITGDLWLLYKDMYTGMTSQVKWGNTYSDTFEEGQGVRQGGTPSTELFKSKGNKLLTRLEESGSGFRIGITNVAAPACADDVVLLSGNPLDLQCMLDMAKNDASCERYQFNINKSKVMVLNSRRPSKAWTEACWWTLGEAPVEVSAREKHLGLIRQPTGTANEASKENIKKAQRCMYSLLGTGVHGMNGIHPEVSLQLWKVYAIPRLAYGLEVLRLSEANWTQLEICQRKILRNILHLPSSTASVALYLISGVLPIQALVERNVLTFFRSMVIDRTTKEYEIVTRQLAMKDMDSKSWVILVKKLLNKYDLPSAYVIIENPPSKLSWKHKVKTAIHQFWWSKIIKEAGEKSSLNHLNLGACQIGRIHPVWSSTPYNSDAIRQAMVQTKLLVGRYHLQEHHNKYRNSRHKCPLCVNEDENLYHFLYICPTLDHIRNRYTHNIECCITSNSSEENLNRIKSDRCLQERLLLEPSSPTLHIDVEAQHQLQSLTRSMTYALHLQRSCIIKEKLQQKK